MKKALLILVIIFGVWFTLMQVIPGKTAQAVDVTDTIHFISNVKITNTDGTALGSGVSKTAAIKLTYDFSIDNTADIHVGDTFTLNIPRQIRILLPTDFTINNTDDGAKIADGIMSTNGTIALTFTDFASRYSNVHGSFWFDLRFDEDQIGGTNPEVIVFNVGGTADPVTVQVDFEQPTSPNASIQKSGELTAANEITWTITINPENVAVNNAKVVDSIASGQEFTAGSVTINGSPANASDYTFASGTLTYNFPATITSQQIITLKTKVLDSEFSGATEGAVLHESNNATLNHDGTSVASNQAVVDVPVNFIDKSGEYDADTKKINWTINVDEIYVGIGNAVVRDTLPAGVTLDPTSVKLDGAPFTADTSALPIVTFNLGNINSPHVITFSTPVDTVFYHTNESLAYHNEVELTGTGVPANTTSSDDVTVPSIVIRKVGSDYNPVTHQITWIVTVNTNNITIENAVVTDPIMPGQEYVPGSAAIDNGADINGFVYTAADRTLKYTFASTINSTYVLSFNTVVADPSVYSGNTPDTLYTNTAYFNGMVDGNSVPTSQSEDSAIVYSQVINKTATGYDYQTNEITWNIAVNDNKMPLDGVVVTDVIPSGQEYVQDSATIDGGASALGFNYTSATHTLTYTFPGTINQTYNISFNTRITDPTVFATNGEKTLQNTATIRHSLIPGGVTSTGTKTIENMVISKGASYTPGNRYIDWTVEINMNGMNLINPKIMDQLPEGLDLDTLSVKLYHEAVNADGSTTVGAEIPLDGDNVEYLDTTRTFNFYLPDGSTGAYMLTYRTMVTDKTKSPFTNTARFDGTGIAQTNSTNPVAVSYTDSGSVGYGEVGSIRVFKVDARDHTTLLADASFELIDKYGNMIETKTTDASGSVLFENLRFDVDYTVKETVAPPGYTVSATEYTFQIRGADDNKDIAYTFEDSAGEGNIKFTKTDGVNPLPGAEFTLFTSDETGEHPVTTATSSSAEGARGTVLFENVPLGEYIIRETKAPDGYLAYPSMLDVSLTEEGKTVTPTKDGAKMEYVPNARMTGNIQFNKKDEYDTILPGAEFALYAQGGTTVLATATSDEDGLVLFENIPLGTYTIRETKAPDGYAISTTPITATITADGATVTAAPAVVVDGTKSGNIKISKISSLGKAPLEGGVFALFFEGDKYFDYPLMFAVSDSNGMAVFEDIPLGDYTIVEILAPEGYNLSKAVAHAKITQDGQTVNASPYVIEDTPYIGKVQVIKTSADGSARLSGAKFYLYPQDDTDFSSPVANATSDNNGVATFQDIPYGKYAIREISAPSGYYINNTILYVQVTKDGETVSAGRLTDTKIPTAANSPQTGDNILNYALIMAGAATAAVAIFVTRNNRKKKIKYTAKH